MRLHYSVKFKDGSEWNDCIDSIEELTIKHKQIVNKDTKRFNAWFSNDVVSMLEFKRGFKEWLSRTPEANQVLSIKFNAEV
jgi:hypothetical protein